ncbi:uncharacterized protein LOC129286000 [Prosopis cineraria]|uniref:uncharacterized protein LOC129286000 n=1 Tax=Prosopis cineraria TaxID=364024 RepID=UPI00240F7312|nr:uncharacterized protein LOC129286000 [Prosopis cineraria]
MAAGVELPMRRAGGGGIAMEFPAGDEEVVQSPPRLPKRLRRRLLDVDKSPSTIEEIEAKLRDADLRRQKYYEKLSNKARSKPRSFMSSSFQEEDRGLRLEAKLQAAEQKRLSILAKAQMRLARFDELRQAAKICCEDERVKCRAKVESCVQQAEANRMLLLKACKQRRASHRERYAQSLWQRIVREEHVRAAIHQKRATAEIKRLGLLEAEKKRAHARLLQVRHIVKSVSQQREMERRKKNDQLEDRIQKARRQRAEYLRQRGRLHGNAQENWDRMPTEAELLSEKVARCWRRFVRLQRTTLTLAKAFSSLGIDEKSAKSMPFEQIALLIESPSTLQVVKSLLGRIESRLKVSRAVNPANCLSSLENIDHLLKLVATPKKSVTSRSSLKSREAKIVGSVRQSNRGLDRLPRYLVRVVLCAYMILGHPDAIFSVMGERESALAKSAEAFVQMFELLIKIILEGPMQCSDVHPDSIASKRCTFRSQLADFDKAWCSYLSCFVIWKVKDAQLLEEDLVKAVCQLEASMIQTCKLTPEGDSHPLSHDDMKSSQHQFAESQRLLKEMVQHLSGNAGIEHMEGALSETRSRYLRVNENGSPLGLPMTLSFALSQSKTNFSPVLSMVSSSSESGIPVESNQIRSHVVRSLFKNATTSSPGGSIISELSIGSDGQLGSSIKKLFAENEVLVNEFLHHHRCSFSVGWGDADFNPSSIEGKIKETMEKAFWDCIMESVKQDQPNYDQVVQLMREVRDEICEMAPQSWKEDIFAAIDVEIFSQVLKSGNLDVDYLGKILEFSLITLQKLSAPVNEEKMKGARQRLFSELTEICQSRDESNYPCVMAMITGLRFVLEQIQTLKKEISKARVRLMEPLIKGPAGLDYLRNAFANRYGSPCDANASLPSTLRWISSVLTCKDQEWEEHISLTSALEGSDSPAQGCLPSTTLQTGGSILVRTSGVQTPISTYGRTTTVSQQPECKGETVDLVVRVGLLKLVSRVSGLSHEDLPETLFLNFRRLTSVQAQIQKIIVISTSILICRQILLSEKVVANPVDMENIISKRAKQLLDLLDRVEDADIKDIVEVICELDKVGDEVSDAGQLQARKEVAARMLAKSLQAGDAVFERVMNAVYSALRGVVLGGSGVRGRKLAEMALRKVGAAVLSERVVEAAEVLILAATISVMVHGQWYKYLTDRM